MTEHATHERRDRETISIRSVEQSGDSLHPDDIYRIANVWYHLERAPYYAFASYLDAVRCVHPLGEVGAMLFYETHPTEYWLEAWNEPADRAKRGRIVGINELRRFAMLAFINGAEYVATDTSLEPVDFYKHLGWTQIAEFTWAARRPENLDEVLDLDLYHRRARPHGMRIAERLRGEKRMQVTRADNGDLRESEGIGGEQ